MGVIFNQLGGQFGGILAQILKNQFGIIQNIEKTASPDLRLGFTHQTCRYRVYKYYIATAIGNYDPLQRAKDNGIELILLTLQSTVGVNHFARPLMRIITKSMISGTGFKR
tara:strand:+ start:239 stop:571 length:333 start_codon:yes stop_codon:yes gene_type:complete